MVTTAMQNSSGYPQQLTLVHIYHQPELIFTDLSSCIRFLFTKFYSLLLRCGYFSPSILTTEVNSLHRQGKTQIQSGHTSGYTHLGEWWTDCLKGDRDTSLKYHKIFDLHISVIYSKVIAKC